MTLVSGLGQNFMTACIRRRDLLILAGFTVLFSAFPFRGTKQAAAGEDLHDLLGRMDIYEVGRPDSDGFFKVPIFALRTMSHEILSSYNSSVMIRKIIKDRFYIINSPVEVKEKIHDFALVRPVQSEGMHAFGKGDDLYLDRNNFSSIFHSRNTNALRAQFNTLHSAHHH